MSSVPSGRRPALRRRVRGALAVATTATVLLLPAAPAASAVAVGEVYPVPAGGVFSVTGRGFGHGHGMSQWGAYGAAKVGGLDYREILAFYYPGTSLVTESPRTVRVAMHAETGGVVVRPIGGRALTARTSVAGVAACPLPASLDGGRTTVKWWRAATVPTDGGVGVSLQATTDARNWRQATVPGCAPAWAGPMQGSVTFDDRGSVDLVHPGGSVTRYRGRMRAAFTGSGSYAVNVVPLEAYLRSVVPSEMPASWSPAALQAQAVAARSYATYGIHHPKTSFYDVYDDTRDQAYPGVPAEAAASDRAVAATAGQVVHDAGGRPAFTQFSAADGGWTADGGRPYLRAHQDPYDGAIPNSADAWTTTLAASEVTDAFSTRIGTLREIDVTARDGHGAWGGRVLAMTLKGSRGSLSMSGTTFRTCFGLRSEWFRLRVAPSRPTYVTAHRAGPTVTVGWRPPAGRSGVAVTGYRVTLRPVGSGQAVSGSGRTVSASARSATFADLVSGVDYSVSVAAASAAGVGRAVTVTTKVRRLGGGNGIRTAAALSRATFAAGTAGGVVLASTRGVAQALASGPFAAAHDAPLLLTAHSAVSAPTRAEIQRVLPAGRTVFLLGGTWAIADGVRTTLAAAGYRVVRLAGRTPAAAAVRLANRVRGVRAVLEASSTTWRQAMLAAPAAARHHGMVLLTNGSTQAPETRRWLAAHPAVRRYAIGAAAAHADPAATPVVAHGAYPLAAVVARRFFSSPSAAAVVSGARWFGAAAAAARLARLHAPLLLGRPTRLPSPAARWLSTQRASLASVELEGAGLAYYDVESRVQRSLLG